MSKRTTPDEPPATERQPDTRDHSPDQDEQVDREGEQSFPASDPPSWTLGPDKA